MNGLDCDGDKATGFKSMVCAQYTGISIQKDDNSFILYNPTTAIFNDTTTVAESEKPLHSNSGAIYKPNYETSHMRTRNNSVIQLVSVFGALHMLDTSTQNEAVTHLSPTLTQLWTDCT